MTTSPRFKEQREVYCWSLDCDVNSIIGRQHHDNLANKLMPLLAPSIPPGFEPHSSVFSPEVFEHMRIYMNCTDPIERDIREAKLKKTLTNYQRILFRNDHVYAWKQPWDCQPLFLQTKGESSTSVESRKIWSQTLQDHHLEILRTGEFIQLEIKPKKISSLSYIFEILCKVNGDCDFSKQKNKYYVSIFTIHYKKACP